MKQRISDQSGVSLRPEAATPAQSLKIPHGQLLIFTEQLAHLLQAGMTLDEGDPMFAPAKAW
jgi:type II secretory pathway component PulF